MSKVDEHASLHFKKNSAAEAKKVLVSKITWLLAQFCSDLASE